MLKRWNRCGVFLTVITFHRGWCFPVRDEIRTHLATRKTEEMHTIYLQLMELLQLTITSLTSLFAALIAVHGTLRDSGPSGHGKTTCGNDEDAL